MNKITKLAIAVLIAAATTVQADLIISEVMSNSDHPGGAGNGDWWELYNNGSVAVDLTGFSWDDESATADTAVFPSVSIGANEAIVIVDENDGNISTWRDTVWGVSSLTVLSSTAMGDFPGLGAGGDSINLFDASDVLVTSLTFGDSDGGGKTFAWDKAGDSAGFSADGVNGAYTALADGDGGSGIDIGSPGYVVPEPTTAGLLAISGLAMFFIRRRITK